MVPPPIPDFGMPPHLSEQDRANMTDPNLTGPKISVVIPAFNSAWSIRETILSVLAQSHANFDLIVVNDGSTDSLIDVLSPWTGQEPRLRIVSQANLGLAAARNRGLSEAVTEYVAFLDADDIWHPDFLKDLQAALQRNEKAPFAYAHSLRIDDQSRLIPTRPWGHTPRHDFAGLLVVNSVGNGSGAVFRTHAVHAVGGFDVTLRQRGAQGAEDWKLCLQLAARHAPVLVEKYLVCYRLMEGSMSQKHPDRQLLGIMSAMADIRREFPDASPRLFRNGRTMMNGWLTPAFLRKGDYATVVRLLVQSYIANPLWFLSRDLRAVHLNKFAAGLSAAKARKPLSDMVENGQRPFAFLDPGRQPKP